MVTFLRFFRAYRDLEVELEQAASARILAEDNARFWRSRCEQAEESRDGINAEYIRHLKKTANAQAYRSGLPLPFSEVEVAVAVEATPNGQAVPAPPPRRSLRDIQQEAVAQSRKAAHERRMAMANGNDESD